MEKNNAKISDEAIKAMNRVSCRAINTDVLNQLKNTGIKYYEILIATDTQWRYISDIEPQDLYGVIDLINPAVYKYCSILLQLPTYDNADVDDRECFTIDEYGQITAELPAYKIKPWVFNGEHVSVVTMSEIKELEHELQNSLFKPKAE